MPLSRVARLLIFSVLLVGAAAYVLGRKLPAPAGSDSLGAAAGVNLLKPTADLSHWALQQTGAASASLTSNGDVLKVSVSKADGTNWHVQFLQAGIILQEGREYTLRFRAKADAARYIDVLGSVDQAAYQPVGLLGHVPLKTEWQSFSYTFTAHKGDPKAARFPCKIPVFMVGQREGTVWIGQVALTGSR